MKHVLLAGAIAAMTVFVFPGAARAFECPKHFKASEAAIEKVAEDMQGMSDMMTKEQMALLHALLDDAKALLAAARHNHEKPQSAYDHARAIAKADAARSYAEAADIFHFNLMKQ